MARRHWLDNVQTPLSEDVVERVLMAARGFHERFNEHFVEGRDLCPYAKSGRLAGATTITMRRESLSDLDAAHSDLEESVRELAADGTIEVAQWVFPLMRIEPLAWERRAKSLVAQAQKALPGPSELAVAAFHPDLPFSDRTPASLVPLFRRSPDPMIQLVRLDALRRVRGERDGSDRYMDPSEVAMLRMSERPPPPSIAEVVARRNAETVRSEGVVSFEAALRELSVKAHAAYEAIARGQ